MASLLYALHADNVTPNATITATTENASYPATNLQDRIFAKVAKLTGTTGNFVFDFGAAQRVDVIAFGPHNLTAALAGVKIQANATNSWATPTMDVTLTVPSYHEDGQSANVWKDITGESGYDTGGFRYWRLVFGTANAANIAIGEVWLIAQKRTLAKNLLWGGQFGITLADAHPVIEHRTESGVPLIYDRGYKVRQILGSLRTSQTGMTELLSWHRSLRGRVYPTFIVPNSDDTPLADGWFVRFATSEQAIQRQFHQGNVATVAWVEDSRGPAL